MGRSGRFDSLPGGDDKAIVSFEARCKALIKPIEDAEHTPLGKKKKPEPRKVDVMFHKVLSFFSRPRFQKLRRRFGLPSRCGSSRTGMWTCFHGRNGLG